MDEKQIKSAELAHSRNYDSGVKLNESVVNNANIALRTALIINGGAAIAMLTFIGNLYSKNGDLSSRNFTQLTTPLMWFAWGVALAGFAIALAYFTNYSIVAHAFNRSYSFEHPYVHETTSSKWWLRSAYLFQIIAIVTGLASLAFFIIGMQEIKDSIQLFLQAPK
jgi:hypothetical protein